MQRIVRVAGGIKTYLSSPTCLVNSETRRCPFCPDGHRLRIHGWYHRFALLPGSQEACRIAVLRLLCPRQGRTVSLLPDFCLPRRQHGPGLLGLFLAALLNGSSLLKALQRARSGGAPGHSVAQVLLKAFLARRHHLQAYLAGLRTRAVEVAPAVPEARRPLAQLVLGLLEGFPDVISAFEHHARHFHHRFQIGLA